MRSMYTVNKFYFYIIFLIKLMRNRFKQAAEASKTTYNKVANLMKAARRTIAPPMPKDIYELPGILEGHEPMKEFYRGSVCSEDGSISIFFITAVMLEALKLVTDLAGDGTFAVTLFALL